MRDRRLARLLGALAIVPVVIGLAACASPPDPEETKDSLTEVTADPTAPDAADEYSAEANPEPIVDPLECSNELVITVRGTAEPRKKQLLSPVAKEITGKLADATSTDIDYPADTDIKEGGTIGVRTLVDTLNVQNEECPDQRFVLLGYSQGALVIGDALADPEARLVGATVGEVDEAAGDRVAAVVLYGNPRFVGSEPYDVGSFDPALNGILPRPVGALDEYAGRIRDFCVDQDFVCQSSLDLNEKGHVSYYSNGMTDEGAEYALATLRALTPKTAQPTE